MRHNHTCWALFLAALLLAGVSWMYVYQVVSTCQPRAQCYSTANRVTTRHPTCCDTHVPGSTELAQVHYYWSLLTDQWLHTNTRAHRHAEELVANVTHLLHHQQVHDSYSTRPWNRYQHYGFLANHTCDVITAECTVTFRVHELITHWYCFSAEHATAGGSTFRIVLSNDVSDERMLVRSSCSVIDEGDGTYTVCCTIPAALGIQVVQLNMYHMHTNYDAFSKNAEYKPLNTLTFRAAVDLSSRQIQPAVDYQRDSCTSKNFNNGHGTWILDKNQDASIDGWRWLSDSCVMPLYNSSQVQQCIGDRYNYTGLFIGASHTRYNFMRILEDVSMLEPGVQGKFQHHYGKDSMRFYWSPYFIDVLNNLASVLDNIIDSHGTMPPYIILSSGAWDLHYNGLARSLQSAIPLLDYLRRVYRSGILANTRIIWVGLVAYPDVHPLRDQHNSRNNNAIAAMNKWLSVQLEDIGVVYVDPLPMTALMQDMTICGAHYLCAEPVQPDQQAHIYGQVGLHVMNLILQQLCMT